jgi:hypothetical protein
MAAPGGVETKNDAIWMSVEHFYIRFRPFPLYILGISWQAE